MKNTIRFSSFLLVACFWLSCCAFAAVDQDRETLYTEALVAYHSKKYDDALKMIEPWVKTSKPPLKFLELQGLAQKEKGDLNGAYETYQKLFGEVSQRGEVNSDAAPYVFEMGLLKYHQKDFNSARRHLLTLKETEFNSDATSFLLGAMDYQEKRFNTAEESLQRVVGDEESTLRSAAHLYLGNLYAETGFGRAAIRNFRNARRISIRNAEEGKADSLTAQVSSASAKALLQMARSRTYGSVGILGGYDSNVFLLPASLISAGATGESTVKGTFLGNLGYDSSLIRKWQFSADYRTSFNYNTNSEAQDGQYFANDLILTATKDPVETTSWGFKLETLGIMRVGAAGIALYNITPFFGPVLTHEFSPSVLGRIELLGYYQSYTEDEGTAEDYFKSGFGGRAKFSVVRQDPGSNWNPAVALTLDMAQTTGTEFRAKGATLDVSNPFDLSKVARLVPTISAGYVIYSERSGGSRTDIPLTVGATLLYELRAAWSLIASASYTLNESNITDLYRYSRIQSSAGVSYSF